MTRRTLVPLLTLLAATLPAGPASAAFETPVELGHGTYRVAASVATDAAGASTAILSGVQGGTRIVQRPSPAGPWAPSARLPGRDLGRAAGPVLAAAGQGALAVAWRIDTPKRYAAIAATVADPGGLLAAPAVISDPEADGVRHPAVAVDGSGRAVLAYNTDTRAVHLSLTGAIAIGLRGPGGAFSAPTVVDRTPSSRPAVALAEDGHGIVAWTHDRRVWAASVDTVAGTVGKVVALTGEGPHASVVATAGPGGAATVAWLTHRSVGSGATRTTRYAIEAAHRIGGARTFPKTPATITPAGKLGYVATLVTAADERGTTTVAWTARVFDQDRTVGVNGISASVQSATIGNTQTRFARTVVQRPDGEQDCGTPAIAARAGRSALAWACNDRRQATVSTRLSTARTLGPPTPLLTYHLNPRTLTQATPVAIGLDATGTATILAITSELPDPTKPEVRRVLATTGR